ncbi:hypothetical protein [Pedobacter sp. SYSU D00535]|uniref:hypothetical protein n=1 Tax=Pedobacter sp. SYSU D00535 TaxID=2810308 RepID=UPI001A969973|nr:hypothetical protein [Pedobacter sp. SYSU D00535]
MTFFTLIHVSETEESIHNTFVTDTRKQISLYLSCAIQLSKSVKKQGFKLVVLTNNKAYLESLIDDADLSITELRFLSVVPSGIMFFSAHFKLQVFNYLSKLQDDYVALVDSDIVCINQLPESLKKAILEKTPLYYDITKQVVPAYGQATIIANKQRLDTSSDSAFWAGGEFIAGPPAFFSRLDKEINQLTDSYFANYKNFHHQGDEMLTTIAIEKLKKSEEILDAGSLNIIGRFWSVKPKHEQARINNYSGHFLLHLPSDKPFIFRHSKTKSESDFLESYKKYLIRKKTFRFLFGSFIPVAKVILKKVTRLRKDLTQEEKLVISGQAPVQLQEAASAPLVSSAQDN